MKIVNMHDAKTHLSRLVEAATTGEPFIIARSGRPLVKVEALDATTGPVPRIGFLSKASIPDDFDTMGADEIAAAFGSP